jgi:hypothetical protein
VIQERYAKEGWASATTASTVIPRRFIFSDKNVTLESTVCFVTGCFFENTEIFLTYVRQTSSGINFIRIKRR